MKHFGEIAPDKDTGWGLIFRLNDLLNEVENLSIQGKYDDWNFRLDRIWTNLIYREKLTITRDENNNIVAMELDKSDFEEKTFIDNKLMKVKKDLKTYERLMEKNPGNNIYISKYKLYKNNLYDVLLLKNIWVIKLMHKQGLYIKELKSNPAGAMWGK